jgi:hypothetical protein
MSINEIKGILRRNFDEEKSASSTKLMGQTSSSLSERRGNIMRIS